MRSQALSTVSDLTFALWAIFSASSASGASLTSLLSEPLLMHQIYLPFFWQGIVEGHWEKMALGITCLQGKQVSRPCGGRENFSCHVQPCK